MQYYYYAHSRIGALVAAGYLSMQEWSEAFFPIRYADTFNGWHYLRPVTVSVDRQKSYMQNTWLLVLVLVCPALRHYYV